MATSETPSPIDILRQGVEAWNEWRRSNSRARPLLYGADLREDNLCGADLRGAQLVQARLAKAKLDGADMRNANLSGASLREASLRGAQLQKSVLRHANLSGADIEGANFDGCEIYGTGLWNLRGQPASSLGMRVSTSPQQHKPRGKEPPADDAKAVEPRAPTLEVDHLDAAQFLFVLLDNPRIGHAFEALNSRIVLILGRFGDGHLARLKAMQSRLLATGDYVPIVFDFERPPGRSLTESVAGFAHLSLFVIADLTDPRSIPQELSHIVPHLPSVPVLPLVPRKEDIYSMFEHFQRYPWVLAPVEYGTPERLMELFDVQVIQAGHEAALRLRAEARRWG
ncbi:MAG: pentapeptide repeat-containing protein [Piscinibacter sp.]